MRIVIFYIFILFFISISSSYCLDSDSISSRKKNSINIGLERYGKQLVNQSSLGLSVKYKKSFTSRSLGIGFLYFGHSSPRKIFGIGGTSDLDLFSEYSTNFFNAVFYSLDYEDILFSVNKLDINWESTAVFGVRKRGVFVRIQNTGIQFIGNIHNVYSSAFFSGISISYKPRKKSKWGLAILPGITYKDIPLEIETNTLLKGIHNPSLFTNYIFKFNYSYVF